MKLNVVISSIYWPLILFFPAAILRKAASNSAENTMTDTLMYIPLEMDLALHAVPAVALALDFYMFERKYGRKSTVFLAPLVAFAYAIWYGGWVEHCSSRNNGICMWPYTAPVPLSVLILGSSPIPIPHRQYFQRPFGNLRWSRICCTFVVLDS